MVKLKLYQYVIWGLFFAIVGEFYNNLIIYHRGPLILLIAAPIYALFLTIIFWFYRRTSLSPLAYSIFSALIGLVLVENIILKKYSEPWPIQIFMFSFWFSIVSLPFLIRLKKYLLLLIPFFSALVAALLAQTVKDELFLTLALFQFVFWIMAAAVMTIVFLKFFKSKKDKNSD
ncbi:MAG TPA: hypothetical protein VJK26_01005 [Patescibacteria group bacterium]|nr:hypothetical protein [Patescibacteria group bacterium]